MFKNSNEIKINKCDRSIHKATGILVYIRQTNNKFSVLVQPKNACKLEFSYYVWLPFLYQPQSDIVLFAMINFHIYNIIVTKCKHVIGPNIITSFNEEL